MPLCSHHRGRDTDCLQEHKQLSCKFIGCQKMNRTKFTLPDDMKVHLRTRGGNSAGIQSEKRKAAVETTAMPPILRGNGKKRLSTLC